MEKNGSILTNISADSLIRAVVKNLSMVISAMLICIMSVSLYADFIHVPQYTATMTYAVTSKRSSYFSSLNMSSANEVAGVLSELIGSDVVKTRLRQSREELSDFDGSLVASLVANSNFISVTSHARSPEQAFLSLKSLITIFPSLSDYISDRSVIQVIRYPVVSTTPSNTMDAVKYEIVSAIIGGALIIALICWDHIRQEKVQTREGAKMLIDAKIIGSVCHENKSTWSRFRRQKKKAVQVFDPTTSFAYTEQIGAICSHLEHEASAHGKKVFLITGVSENEGKSTLSANIAAALALRKKNVALVDVDLRNPSLNRFFDSPYNSSIPLNKLLAGQVNKESVFNCIQRHETLGLYMLFSHEPDPRCTELITSNKMPYLISKLRAMDFVIIDSPPMGFFPDAEAMAELCDASILVVRRDTTPTADVNDAVDSLRECKADFLGVILNNMPMESATGTSTRYGYGYSSGYGYGYGSGYGYGYGYGKSGYGKSGYGKSGYGYGVKPKSQTSDKSHNATDAGSQSNGGGVNG